MSEGYEALRNGAAWVDLAARGRIAVRGRDRARLLHNLTTNDVKTLAAGRGCYAFMLTPQGRIQADILLFAFEDRFLIETEPELREKVPQLIRRYVIADQVELEDVSTQTGEIGIEGPAAAALLAICGAPVPEGDYEHLRDGEAIIANASLTGQPGFRIFCAAESAAQWIERLESAGAMAATADDVRTVRIENGKPRYGDDITESSLPQETGQMHAISFTKGCYLGQEIVERIRARGHINRKLTRVELPGDEPAVPGAAVEIGGQQAQVTSSIYSPQLRRVIALAYVRQ